MQRADPLDAGSLWFHTHRASECRSECIHHYRQLSSSVSDVIWLLQAKTVAVTVCAEQLQRCHAPAPHSPVSKELSLLLLFLMKNQTYSSAQTYRSPPALCSYSTQHLWAPPGDHRWQQSQHSPACGDWQFVSQLQFKWRKIALFAPLWVMLGFVSE